jgi:hypothetical protein
LSALSRVSASCWAGVGGFVVVVAGSVVGGDVVGAAVVGEVGGAGGTVMIVGGDVGGTVAGSVTSVVVVLVLVLVVVELDVVEELVVVVRRTSIAFVLSSPPLLSAIAKPMIARPPTAAPPTIIAARCCR